LHEVVVLTDDFSEMDSLLMYWKQHGIIDYKVNDKPMYLSNGAQQRFRIVGTSRSLHEAGSSGSQTRSTSEKSKLVPTKPGTPKLKKHITASFFAKS